MVRANLRLYFHRFEVEWGVSREGVLERARLYRRVIEERDPGYAEAMEGLAEGSDIPLLDIIALNARYEIIYSEYSRIGRQEPGEGLPAGCTSFALLPSHTSEGHLLMAQNWDWIPGIRGVVQRYKPDRGPEVLAFTEAGIIGGKIGLNSAGVGLLINGLVSDKDDWSRLGTPFHVRCWQALLSESMEEAVRRVRGSPSSCSANFLLGQARGPEAVAVDLEMAPVGVEEVRPGGGFLLHANHFLREEELGIRQPLLKERTSTYERYRRLEDLLRQRVSRGERLGIEDVKGLLRDHDGHPNSICRHQEENLPPEERYETVVSVIMDLQAREMLISSGPPCASDYARFRLEG
jgi:isopenicillin-N N-acyltransferase-like protein